MVLSCDAKGHRCCPGSIVFFASVLLFGHLGQSRGILFVDERTSDSDSVVVAASLGTSETSDISIIQEATTASTIVQEATTTSTTQLCEDQPFWTNSRNQFCSWYVANQNECVRDSGSEAVRRCRAACDTCDLPELPPSATLFAVKVQLPSECNATMFDIGAYKIALAQVSGLPIQSVALDKLSFHIVVFYSFSPGLLTIDAETAVATVTDVSEDAISLHLDSDELVTESRKYVLVITTADATSAVRVAERGANPDLLAKALLALDVAPQLMTILTAPSTTIAVTATLDAGSAAPPPPLPSPEELAAALGTGYSVVLNEPGLPYEDEPAEDFDNIWSKMLSFRTFIITTVVLVLCVLVIGGVVFYIAIKRSPEGMHAVELETFHVTRYSSWSDARRDTAALRLERQTYVRRSNVDIAKEFTNAGIVW